MPDLDNEKVLHVSILLREYFRTDAAIAEGDRRLEDLATARALIHAQNNKLISRQVSIVEELRAGFRQAGTIDYRTAAGVHVALTLPENASYIHVSPLHGYSALAVEEPRSLSDAEISEAALYAAAESFTVTEDDGELEGWLDDDVISIPTAVTNDERMALLKMALSKAAPTFGRHATISNGVAVHDQAAS